MNVLVTGGAGFVGSHLTDALVETGSNLEIIEDGKSGFLAETEQDWYEKLLLLLEDAGVRRQFGAYGRNCAVERFNIERQYDFLEQRFKELAEKSSVR